jgi:murein DD-endopeptidase MepM/ murein hydrolase activator NlpD
MLNEKIRLMYFSRGTSLKQFSLDPRRFILYSSAGSVALVLIVALALQLFTGLFQNLHIDTLEKDKNQLQKELLILKEKIALLNDRMTEIENMDDILRNAAGLPVINQDIRQVGVGGPYVAADDENRYYADELGRTTLEIQSDLNKFERELHLVKNSLKEVSSTLDENDRMAHQTPSIRPILGATIRQNFGLRMDPFLDRIASHQGVDVPMPLGTNVLATADGVVKTANTLYTPHKSYGMEVVIDHGYGYETRYAHLSKILVRPGERVKRWQVIGQVGETGRTTGPHLHYEVMLNGKPENPMHFVIN